MTGEKVTADMNEKILVSEAQDMLKGNPALSNVKSDVKDVKIGNLDGKKLTFTFTETGRGKSTDLTVDEYIFTQKDTVWRIIYQYRSADTTGQALAERVSGKIVLGSEF